MAITNPRDLRDVNSVAPLQRIKSDLDEVKTFGESAAAALTIPRGAPVAYNNSTDVWVPWVHSGANGTNVIRGIAWPAPITINATGDGDVTGSVMLRGEAHYEDLDLAATASVEADLVTSLQEGGNSAGLRTLGIDIKGLAKVI